MDKYSLKTIGYINSENGEFSIKIEKDYLKALKGIGEFEYIQVVWWFNKVSEDERNLLIEKKPYKEGPDELGVFATRSPFRPNPIGVTTTSIISIDYEHGVIIVPYIDAYDKTPVLDIKPYTPSIDRVENIVMPAWCSKWPNSYEKSGDFDWSKVFNFEE